MDALLGGRGGRGSRNGLVVGWVTTSEYPLLYVFAFFNFFFCFLNLCLYFDMHNS
jgi:hypothetical protein